MRIDLDTEQVDALHDLLATTLRELSYEIASADLPSYRQMLRERREVLRSTLDALGGAVPASRPATG